MSRSSSASFGDFNALIESGKEGRKEGDLNVLIEIGKQGRKERLQGLGFSQDAGRPGLAQEEEAAASVNYQERRLAAREEQVALSEREARRERTEAEQLRRAAEARAAEAAKMLEACTLLFFQERISAAIWGGTVRMPWRYM